MWRSKTVLSDTARAVPACRHRVPSWRESKRRRSTRSCRRLSTTASTGTSSRGNGCLHQRGFGAYSQAGHRPLHGQHRGLCRMLRRSISSTVASAMHQASAFSRITTASASRRFSLSFLESAGRRWAGPGRGSPLPPPPARRGGRGRLRRHRTARLIGSAHAGKAGPPAAALSAVSWRSWRCMSVNTCLRSATACLVGQPSLIEGIGQGLGAWRHPAAPRHHLTAGQHVGQADLGQVGHDASSAGTTTCRSCR